MMNPGGTVSSHTASRGRGVRRIDLSAVHRASSSNARDINRDIVLEIIRFRQPVSRVEISRFSGLQPSTVSTIVEHLMEEGWIQEGAVVRIARGRPQTMLKINDQLVTFALDIRPNRAILAVIDIAGRILSRETIMTFSDPKVSMKRIVERIASLRAEHAEKRFEGIGVSVPGRVDPSTERLLLAPNLSWHNFDIRAAIEEATGLQAEVDNDANACLLAESWYGRLTGVKHAVLVAVSEGIGAAILADGQLYSGHNGMAGEFGHISIDPNGPVCACGQRGCWEVMASSRAAVRFYLETCPEATNVDVFFLLRAAEEGDEAAIEALSRQAHALGWGLRLITASLSPEVILLAGDLTIGWERFGPIIKQALESNLLAGPPPRLATAGDAELARLLGAAAVLLQRHGSYHRSTHAPKQESMLSAAVVPLSLHKFPDS